MGGVPIRICKLTLTHQHPLYCFIPTACLLSAWWAVLKFIWVILGQLFQFSNPAFAKGRVRFQNFCTSISGGTQTLQKIASDPIIRKLFPFQLPFNTSYGLQDKQRWRGFPGGPVVKNLPSSAGSVDSIPGWGTKIPHATGQVSLYTHDYRARTLQLGTPVRCRESSCKRQWRSHVPSLRLDAAR